MTKLESGKRIVTVGWLNCVHPPTNVAKIEDRMLENVKECRADRKRRLTAEPRGRKQMLTRARKRTSTEQDRREGQLGGENAGLAKTRAQAY